MSPTLLRFASKRRRAAAQLGDDSATEVVIKAGGVAREFAKAKTVIGVSTSPLAAAEKSDKAGEECEVVEHSVDMPAQSETCILSEDQADSATTLKPPKRKQKHTCSQSMPIPTTTRNVPPSGLCAQAPKRSPGTANLDSQENSGLKETVPANQPSNCVRKRRCLFKCAGSDLLLRRGHSPPIASAGAVDDALVDSQPVAGFNSDDCIRSSSSAAGAASVVADTRASMRCIDGCLGENVKGAQAVEDLPTARSADAQDEAVPCAVDLLRILGG